MCTFSYPRICRSLTSYLISSQNNKDMLQIRDVQLRPTPLEEVFLTITKKAELENAEVR